MFEKINLWRPTLITNILYLLVGVFMMLKPQLVTHYFFKVIGVLGIIYGVYSLIMYFSQKNEEDKHNVMDLIIGVVVLIISVALIMVPEKAIHFIIFIAGLYFIIDGVLKVTSAIKVARLITGSGLVVGLSVFLPIALGAILMIIPISAYDNIAWLFGLCLIISSSMDIYSIYHLNHLLKKEKEL